MTEPTSEAPADPTIGELSEEECRLLLVEISAQIAAVRPEHGWVRMDPGAPASTDAHDVDRT